MIETAQTNISQDDIIFTTIQNQFQISMNGMTTKMHSKTNYRAIPVLRDLAFFSDHCC